MSIILKEHSPPYLSVNCSQVFSPHLSCFIFLPVSPVTLWRSCPFTASHVEPQYKIFFEASLDSVLVYLWLSPPTLLSHPVFLNTGSGVSSTKHSILLFFMVNLLFFSCLWWLLFLIPLVSFLHPFSSFCFSFHSLICPSSLLLSASPRGASSCFCCCSSGF